MLNLDFKNENSQEFEVLKVILPISVDQFFQKFFSDEAEYSIKNHLEKIQAININVGQWNKNDDLEGFTKEI